MFILVATQSSISSPWHCFFILPALAQIVNLRKAPEQKRAGGMPSEQIIHSGLVNLVVIRRLLEHRPPFRLLVNDRLNQFGDE